MQTHMAATATLPADGYTGALVGRCWLPDVGPSVVAVRADGVFDLTRHAPTMSELMESADAADLVRRGTGTRIATLADLLSNTPEATRDTRRPWLLAPVDLQAIRAAGVTFPRSMLERVIEERAKGSPESAALIRVTIAERLGGDLRQLKPGSAEARSLKEALIKAGAWSQYLEVGIGEDAEIFTKAQPLSAIGHGMDAGLHPRSTWNNPEPEIVLVVQSSGRIVGATLGNDVNLRDFEGRSALLLSKAKDNTGSAAIGPFIRLFDQTFSLDDVRRADVRLTVEGADGFQLNGLSSMSEIARDPLDLVENHLIGPTHQYPDGVVLYLGTMFAPIEDRDQPGRGFTHKAGDIVTIATEKLGALTNRMTTSDRVAPWTFGATHLMQNLGRRGLLGPRSAAH